jgi:hypothetical protein
MLHLSLKTLAVVGVVGVSFATHAVDAPFVETFDGGAFSAIGGFTQDGTATTSLTGDAFVIDLDTDTSDQFFFVDVPNVPTTPGTQVTTSVDFTITGDSTDVTTFGVTMFGTGTDAGTDTYYEFAIVEPGGFVTPEFSLNEVGADPDTDLDPDNILSTLFDDFEDATFTLTVTATLLPTGALFDFSITDGVTLEMSQVTDTATTTSLGTVFGIVADTFSGSTNSAVTVDNFSVVVVPEPASLALIAVGGLAAMRRRR